MKKSFRLLAAAATAVIGLSSVMLFAGCDTNYPEVTITYEFNGNTYEVEYVLSRKGAPQTVQHFIELADAGYYDGTVIHNYTQSGIFLYGGGYVYNDDGELEEKDYWNELRRLEKEKNIVFTQTVYANGKDMRGYFSELEVDGLDYVVGGQTYSAEDVKIPLYTLHGEFENNGVPGNSKTYYHNQQGTLGMYYPNTGSNNISVGTIRTNGDYEEGNNNYRFNCTTSLFYTWTGTGSNPENTYDANYSAFGKTKDYSSLKALIDAVEAYAQDLDADADEDGLPFTNSETVTLSSHDPIDLVRNAKITAIYNVPVSPIVIRTVKVTKY